MDRLGERIVNNFIFSKSAGNYSEGDVKVFLDFYKSGETIDKFLVDNNMGNKDMRALLTEFQKFSESQKELKSHKVAMVMICINQLYWEYAKNIIDDTRKFFLPGHQTDIFLWSDMPEGTIDGVKVFPTEPLPWPAGTLYRYHLFLQQKELLKDYDYIFYCDVDMRMVNYIGDEILGDLVAAQHPMYAVKKNLWPPYEPNELSTAYIPRPGQVISDNGKPRFMPLYFAGGFQGGSTKEFLKACEVISKNIDEDENKLNYIAVWNDETHWNKYLFLNKPTIVLTPSYIYPDSLIKEYYEPLWGCSYPPKLVTLTKKFSVKPLSEAEQKELLKMKDLK